MSRALLDDRDFIAPMTNLLLALNVKRLLARLHTWTLPRVASFAIRLTDIHLAQVNQAGRDRDLHLRRIVVDLAMHTPLDVVGPRAVACLARNALGGGGS